MATGGRIYCAEYADIFKQLCEEAGIECRVVEGVTSGGDAHAWNYIPELDLYVDCTWDDTSDTDKWFLFEEDREHGTGYTVLED